MADSHIFEGLERGHFLREETGLHGFCDFEFLGGAPLGFQSLGSGTALRFDGVSDFVKADERKRIAVEILEAGEDAAPNWSRLTAR